MQSTTRRAFTKQIGLVTASAALTCADLFAEQSRKIRPGYTGITWLNSDVDKAIHDVGQLGFYGYETFGDVLAKKALMGALTLYLDFVNLFLMLRQLTGGRRS
jgi:inosose dehydratase